jgi:hypothetical protein
MNAEFSGKKLISCLIDFYLFFFWQYWGLNSGLDICEAQALYHLSHSLYQSPMVSTDLPEKFSGQSKWGYWNNTYIYIYIYIYMCI